MPCPSFRRRIVPIAWTVFYNLDCLICLLYKVDTSEWTLCCDRLLLVYTFIAVGGWTSTGVLAFTGHLVFLSPSS
jgi:hypothetical protein